MKKWKWSPNMISKTSFANFFFVTCCLRHPWLLYYSTYMVFHEREFYWVCWDIFSAWRGLTSMASGFADKPEREFHDLCLLLDCTPLIGQHTWLASLTAIASDRNHWVGMMSALNMVPVLVSILSSMTRMMPIALEQTAVDFVVEIHTRQENQATDILAHWDFRFVNTDAFLVAVFQVMRAKLEQHKIHS